MHDEWPGDVDVEDTERVSDLPPDCRYLGLGKVGATGPLYSLKLSAAGAGLGSANEAAGAL